MIHQAKLSRLALTISLACAGVPAAFAAEEGFLGGASATLHARNYYFSRDFSDIVGPSTQSKAEEWAQGFVLNAQSGFTDGPVGFGLDAIGLLGLKLDSSPDRAGTGLLPGAYGEQAPDDYSRLGVAAKMRISKTVLRVGELQPNLPVLTATDNRLLPNTYQGASLVSNEIDGLTLQGGQLRSTSLRNEAGDGEMATIIGYRPNFSATSDRFNYAGADYAFNGNRTSVGLWYAQLEDIYNQRHASLKHSQPMGAWTLGANLGFYDSAEDGDQLIGKLDNQAFYSLLSAKHGGHTFYLGYQAMYGDDGFPRLFVTVSPLGNEVPTYEFASPDERSWQLRYDYDFAAMGVPGLVAGVRYLKGDNVDTGRGFEGKDFERDLDIGYVLQSGALKGLGVRVRNVTARSNYRTDIDENRLILTYTWKLF
ncbi:OprD family porin [Pseudomonas oligotrophica]|uniref:OprD family porin n=1 Tax=Pseudomonas oligotrophica TaxID=2912055 RepID=UPI001F388F89|nr:OprD family porin [Pseudomonas oligotrophica]MCF7204089.1 OprD family porin [Pseudomonas oligotrophica]